ncbi:hypothetical protein [Rhizobium sp. NZLR1]|uniref:hypothetical protein n=1 Tax=Rhizobium sp. NZLR1 TaxID=2731096 RepID=UPI001A97F738|nr:hypothetical protein [Rhizobium sp. NZLR1]MBX5201040.1 hypothetical protein [Rhizobium sp. NZLR1]QSZ21529.1 hypothetical protein J3O30_02880 [Rhizobium sp. NZLR1]
MRTLLLGVLLFTSTFDATAIAADRATSSQVTELVTKVGISSVNIWLKEQRVALPPSTLSTQMRSEILERTLDRYAAIRNGYYATSQNVSWAGLGAVGTFGAIALYGGPQAVFTVPATVMAAVAGSVTDNVTAHLESTGAEVSRQYLAANKSAILQQLGVRSYAELGNNPQDINDRLNNASDLIADLRDRAGGDQILADHARDLLSDTLVSTAGATLDTLDLQGRELSSLSDEFYKFVDKSQDFETETIAALEKHTREIGAISSQVDDLTAAVADVDEQMKQQGKNQAFISDFIFDQMAPDQKADGLQRGFMSERFACPTGERECAGSKMKASLVSRFRAEAQLKSSIATVSSIAGGLADVSTIARNLGIDSPDLNRAVEVGNAATNALAAYASGNPIGAVAAITGVFAQKRDPDAERFQVMMRALAQIDHKLDIIIENQKALMEAVNQLSVQLATDFQALNEHLAAIKWEQDRMSEAVRQLIWKDWRSCYDFVKEASERSADGKFIHIDERSRRFRTFQDMQTVFGRAGTSFRACLETVRGGLASLDRVAQFGNFIDARLAYNDLTVIDPRTLALGEEKDKWSSALQSYETELFGPAHTLTTLYLFHEGVDPATGLSLLSTPAPSLAALDEQLKTFRSNALQCYSGSERDKRFYPLICGDQNAAPGEKANFLLQRAVLADFADDIAQWIVLISQMADLYDQQDQRIYTSIPDLLQHNGGSGVGRDLVAKAVVILDLAISSYDQTYGGIPAKGAVKVLDETTVSSGVDDTWPSKVKVIKLLLQNSYLAQNVATVLLNSHRKDKNSPLDASIYRLAYEYAERSAAHNDFLLTGLFDSTLVFTVNADGVPCLHLAAADASIDIPLPPPTQLVEGRFVFPQRFFKLLATRDLLVDRLFDYAVLDETPQMPGEAVAAALVR